MTIFGSYFKNKITKFSFTRTTVVDNVNFD